MTPDKKVKILATLGPAIKGIDDIRQLVEAGVNIFRLNFSHGEHADHALRYQWIREVEQQLNYPLGILMDLQGPKLRVGRFAEGKVQLQRGQALRLDLDKTPGDSRRVNLPHPEIIAALEPGMDLLLDDGKLRLRVTAKHSDAIDTEVLNGGELSDRKGVNVPQAVLDLSPLTEKDRRDLAFGLELGVDWVALSFVQRPEDIVEARQLIGDRAYLMAKIEKPSAVEQLQAIAELADAIMVARGDLGVEVPAESVPQIQKRIIGTCRQLGKPVVVATQMLESMRFSPAPTRAEVTDVANAVAEGADAVMLSAETASGDYPLGSRADDEQDHPPGGEWPGLPGPARRRPAEGRGDRIGRHQLRHPPHQRHPAGGGAGQLQRIGRLDPACGPRAATGTDPQPDAEPGHRTPPERGLGCSLGGQRPPAPG
jgi:pyruvate kinase (EC 2.7.1.40)